MSDIGFFIWCHNDEEWLINCITTFKGSTKGAYLLGIDNGSIDATRHLLDFYCDYVIENAANYSMSECVNTGYSHLYGRDFKYLGWIHPDMSFNYENWHQVLKDTLNTYPQVGKVSIWNMKYSRPPVRAIIPGAEAGNLIRRESWEEIGPYDEDYIGCGGYEDWDIQQRFIEAGLANCINTEARAFHQHVGTRGKIPHEVRHEMWAHNQGIYHKKWNTFENEMVPDGWRDISLT